MIHVGQKRRMAGNAPTGWTYTVTAIEGHNIKLVSEHGTEYEWSDHFIESDEIVPNADPANPQVGDRFAIYGWPNRQYEVLEVGLADTVKVRYYIDAVWDKARIHQDIPL